MITMIILSVVDLRRPTSSQQVSSSPVVIHSCLKQRQNRHVPPGMSHVPISRVVLRALTGPKCDSLPMISAIRFLPGIEVRGGVVKYRVPDNILSDQGRLLKRASRVQVRGPPPLHNGTGLLC